MVLISIHPFALRRLFLVVLAVAGFSALCFADPVLMAQRYGSEKPRLTVTKTAAAFNAVPAPASDRFANLQSTDLSSPVVAETAFALDEKAISAGLLASAVSWSSQDDGPIKAFYGTASDSRFLRTNQTD